jgi:site-specific DNA recombinase
MPENAKHEPIIDSVLFRRVQAALHSPHKSKSRKGLFPYTNLIRCGVCGCSLTADIKKEKYIYYRCTGYKGKCNQPYLKQEAIDAAFEELLGDINLTTETQAQIMQGLRESHKDKIEYHNNCIKQLQTQIKKLQGRIDQTYLDKLDKIISEGFWQTQTAKWLQEKETLTIKLLAHQKADTNYLENANLVIELARKAATLFKKQNVEQKRRMVNLLVSNSTYKDEKLEITLRNPFNLIMCATQSGNWLPEQDSNLRPSG